MAERKSTPKKAATPAKANTERRTLEPHEILTSSSIQNTISVQAWGKFAGDANLGDLLDDLRTQVKDVVDGNMRPVETMLYGQALALQTIFTSLSRRAVHQDHLKQFQTHLTLALKAQSQCRATLEALAEIKNPRHVNIVQQANIAAGGNQQVNNTYAGMPSHTDAARTGNFQSEPNELLTDNREAQHGATLDTGATSGASRGNPTLAAVDAGNRA